MLRIIRGMSLKELVIATLYGVVLTLLIGVPDTSVWPPQGTEIQAAIEIEHFPDAKLDWSAWVSVDGKEILCPPGQSGFSIGREKSERQLICGYQAVVAEDLCELSSYTRRICSPNAQTKEFYHVQGYRLPSEYSKCCPAQQKAICRFKDTYSNLVPSVHCG